MKHRFRNSVKDVQTLPVADIDSDHNLLVAKVRTRLKKIIRFQNSRPRWDLEKLYAQRQSVQDTLEVKLSSIVCVSGSAEVSNTHSRKNTLSRQSTATCDEIFRT